MNDAAGPEQKNDNAASSTRQQVYFPMPELDRMADAFVESKLFGVKDKSQALSLLLIAQAEGMHPAIAIQEFDIVNGKPARKTHAVLARFQDSGGTIEWLELSEQCARATFRHPKSIAPVTIEWTMEQASKVMVESWDNSPGAVRGAKIKTSLTDKEVWHNYPRAMLRARVIAEGVRATFPRAIGGMLVVEEAQDLGEMIEGSATREETAVEMPKRIARDTSGGEPSPLQETKRTELELVGREHVERETGEIKQKEAEPAKPKNGDSKAPRANENMLKHLRKKIQAAQAAFATAYSEADVAKHFGHEKLEEITVAQINEAIAYVQRQGEQQQS